MVLQAVGMASRTALRVVGDGLPDGSAGAEGMASRTALRAVDWKASWRTHPGRTLEGRF